MAKLCTDVYGRHREGETKAIRCPRPRCNAMTNNLQSVLSQLKAGEIEYTCVLHTEMLSEAEH